MSKINHLPSSLRAAQAKYYAQNNFGISICHLCAGFLLIIIFGWLLTSSVYADDPITPAAQGIINYEILAAPPDITKTPDQWIIYFGPTQDQASASVAAMSIRQYVIASSPLQAIPTLQVVRSVTWIVLTPAQQITLSRSFRGSLPGSS